MKRKHLNYKQLDKFHFQIVIKYNQNFDVNMKLPFVNKKFQENFLMMKINPFLIG